MTNSKAGFEMQVTFRSRKAGREQSMEWNDLPEASQRAIIAYGAQRFINDKLGGSDLTEEDAARAFDKIFLQLREGWEGRQRGPGASVDPVEREAQKQARGRIRQALKAKGLKAKDLPEGKMDELVKNMLESDMGKEIRQKAEEIVKVTQAPKPSVDFDLADLGLKA